jgi:hypothetical protein
MATTFKFMGVEVEVIDPALEAKIKDVVAGGSYGLGAIEKVAPRMMSALYGEQRTLANHKVVASKFTVQGGMVKSEVDGRDRRFNHVGTRLGS